MYFRIGDFIGENVLVQRTFGKNDCEKNVLGKVIGIGGGPGPSPLSRCVVFLETPVPPFGVRNMCTIPTVLAANAFATEVISLSECLVHIAFSEDSVPVAGEGRHAGKKAAMYKAQHTDPFLRMCLLLRDSTTPRRSNM